MMCDFPHWINLRKGGLWGVKRRGASRAKGVPEATFPSFPMRFGQGRGEEGEGQGHRGEFFFSIEAIISEYTVPQLEQIVRVF